MRPEAHSIESILAAAVEIPSAAQRSQYVNQACAGDAELKRLVEELIENHFQAGSFLESPAAAQVATLAEPIGERPGTIIGPYKLLEQIGEGGFGVVFMAEQLEPIRRKVALKVLKPGMDSRQVIARFEAERQALALMDHPNIAKVLEAGQTANGRPYFVMDLVKGLPITAFCDQGQLTPRERLELFLHVVQGVQHAHQKGIIHRDIKPSNVLVTLHEGTPLVKVIDFGIAKALGQQLTDKTLFTGFAQMIGTPLYMSPEQAALSNVDVDTRSDIYSLGVLLYELLTGTTPFDNERLRQVGYDEMRRIIREEEPPRPSTRISTLGQAATTLSTQRQSDPRRLSRLFRGELDWVVMKALEKDRNRRYETASAFAADVQRYLADEPVLACPPSVRYRLGKFVRRHKGQVTAAAAMLALLLAGTAVSTWQAVRATRAERQTSAALDQVTAAHTETREALDALTDDVVETMFTKQPELDETQTAFLRKVLGFYEAFTQQSAETAEARFLRAKGYFKVAHLRGLLGEHAAAVAGYRQAEGLLEALAAEFPDAADYRHKLARTEGNMAVELAKLGKEGEAETALRKGIDLRTRLADAFPGDLQYRLELANNYNDLGFLRELQHRYPEADAAYRQALGLKEKLVADAGAEPKYRLELALTLGVTGQLLRKQGKFAESEQLYRQALQIQQEQLDKVKATPRDRRALANSYSGLGVALAELGRMPEAETALRHAQETRQKLVDDFPRVLEYRQELANGWNNLAYLLIRQGKDAEAEKPYRQALEVRKQIVAQAGNVPAYRQDLANAYHDLGHVLRVIRQPDEAESACHAALDLFKQLVAELPQVPEFHDRLGDTLSELAMLHNQRRQFAAALALLDEGQPHLQTALAARPQDRTFRESWRDRLVALAQSRLGLADYASLATTADELARFGFEPARDSYDAASFLCHCMTLAGEDGQLADARRKELAQSYGDRALALLHQAIALGFMDAAHLKKDPDLDSLRGREEFGKLVADLEGKTKE
jgi:serine/threonine protein kinase